MIPFSMRTWQRHRLGTVALLLLATTSGCAALHPIRGIPAAYMPDEFKAESREGRRTIHLGLLTQAPPDQYRVGPGDVLSVYVPGILGTINVPLDQTVGEAPPINIPQDLSQPPTIGYPIHVRDDGRISLPSVPPIAVTGMTLRQVEDAVHRAYTVDRKLLQDENARVLVSLQRPRQYRVLVYRQETTSPLAQTAPGVINLGNSQKGTSTEVVLPAYQNDVLHALAKAEGDAGGLPGLDAENTIYIIRRRGRGNAWPAPALHDGIGGYCPTPPPGAAAPGHNGGPITPPSQSLPPTHVPADSRYSPSYRPPAVPPANLPYEQNEWPSINSVRQPSAIQQAAAWSPAAPPHPYGRMARRDGSAAGPIRQLSGHSTTPIPPATDGSWANGGEPHPRPATAATQQPGHSAQSGPVPGHGGRYAKPPGPVMPPPAERPPVAHPAPVDSEFIGHHPPHGYSAGNWHSMLADFDPTIMNPNVVKIPVRLAPGERPNFTEQDIILQDGDIVFIESRDTEVFYTGGLLGGGEFTLPRDRDLPVTQAIAVAQAQSNTANVTQAVGGLSALNQDVTVSPSSVVILRKLPDGRQVPIEVNLYKALRRPEENILIQPGDHVILQYTRFEATFAFLERHVLAGALLGVAAATSQTN